MSEHLRPSVRKPVVFSVKSNVWWSPFGRVYFGWRVHMSAFKSTHLSPSALVFFYRVNHNRLLSSPPTPHVKLWRQINTKTPFKITISSDKDGIRQQAIFRIFYFIINRSDNALVHMTLRHIALSNNTKKYIRGMKGLVHSNIDTCTKHERFLKALLLFWAGVSWIKFLSLTCTLWEVLQWCCWHTVVTINMSGMCYHRYFLCMQNGNKRMKKIKNKTTGPEQQEKMK